MVRKTNKIQTAQTKILVFIFDGHIKNIVSFINVICHLIPRSSIFISK